MIITNVASVFYLFCLIKLHLQKPHGFSRRLRKEPFMQFMDLNEKRRHGTSDFPFAFYHLDDRHPRYVMNYHWHQEYELIRVLSGKLEMTLDERTTSVKPGDLVFVHGGVLHSGMPENCVYECLVFDLNVFTRHNSSSGSYIQKILDRSALVFDHFEREKFSSVIPVTDHIFEAMKKRYPGYEMMVIGELYHFFSLVFRHHLYLESVPQTRKGYRKVLQLRKVLDYIDKNYSQPITLDELAAAASMSPKYFCRFFSSMTHRTPMDYLNYQRIEHACYELSTTDNTVTDVAYACGFGDVSYFIKIFRKYKGMTPGTYSGK